MSLALHFLQYTFYKQQSGKLIKSNHTRYSEYPNLIAENPDKQLLYIWIATDINPNIPSYTEDEHHEERIALSRSHNALPVFAGIVLSCYPTDEDIVPLCGGIYIAEFTGFKAID